MLKSTVLWGLALGNMVEIFKCFGESSGCVFTLKTDRSALKKRRTVPLNRWHLTTELLLQDYLSLRLQEVESSGNLPPNTYVSSAIEGRYFRNVPPYVRGGGLLISLVVLTIEIEISTLSPKLGVPITHLGDALSM